MEGQIPQSIPGYRIENVLGEGGTATVYRAVHERLGSVHALKIVAAPDERMRKRLLREGRAQGALRHANLVAVTEVLELQLGPALVLEFVDGPTLAEWLADERPTERQAIELFRGITAGVAAAHRAGFVHRDLKPANVLLARSGGQWVPKVTDFGLAKATLDGEPADSRLVTSPDAMPDGTPAYMAPEQIRQEVVDQRADVFALGCILYELACGRRAFRGDDPLDLFQRILAGDFDDPAVVAPELAPRTVQLIRAMLQVEAELRPTSATEVLQLLEGRDVRLSSRPPVARRHRLSQEIFVAPESRSRALPYASLVLLGLVSLVVAAVLLRPAPEAAGASHSRVRVTVEPADVVVPTPAPQPAPPPVAPAAPKEAPAPVPPRVPVREAQVADAKPAVGSVVVSGDATNVVLVGDEGRWTGGEVPVGSYRVLATFGGQQTTAGTVLVTEGGSATVRCSSFVQGCTITQ